MYKFPHKFISHIFANISYVLGIAILDLERIFAICYLYSWVIKICIMYIIYNVTRNRDKSILRFLIGLLNITVLQSVKIVAQKYLLADLINLQLILFISIAIVFPCIVTNYACYLKNERLI